MLLSKLDRYIMKKFVSTYLFLIAIVILITIIFDYNEKIDKFTQAHVGWMKALGAYYVYFVPYFVNLFSPLFVFLSVIFFTAKLAGGSEIIAMKAAGMSFRRLLRPYLLTAALIAISTLLLGSYVIPRSNVARVNFENAYIKKKSLTTAENVQLQVDTGVVAYITHFDNQTKSGYGFSLDKFEGKKVVSHLTAQSLQYDTLSSQKGSWTLRICEIRTLRGLRERVEHLEKVDTVLRMEPSDFFYVNNQQETLTQPELRDFIRRQSLRGSSGISTFEVEYHKRYAMSLAAFILTVIGASLSSQKRKGGMGLYIAWGIALSFAYILLQTVSTTFATNAGFHPMLAAWLPNLLFIVIALIMYRRTPA